MRRKLSGLLYGTALAILGLVSVSPRLMWTQTLKQGAHLLDSLQELPVGLGTSPKLAIPADNRQNAGKVELGRKLFFNKNLSGDCSMSCATCHNPAKGFSDGKPLAVGFQGKQLGRHTPTLWNVAYNTYQYWDGRALSLEQQVSGPITAAEEMNLLDEAKLVRRLNADPRYRQEFQAVFSEGPSLNSVAKAIAAYERTITTTNSRFNRYAAGDKDALTLHEKNGLVLFIGKARCSRCHDGPSLTDNKFQNIGVGVNDEGRFAVTRQENDRGAFKTPGLFNVALHAPYMHDGSLSTLEAVIDYYERGGNAQEGKSPFILKIGLTANEKQDLLAFLKSLNGSVAVATLAPHRASIEGHSSSKKSKHWQN
jgi:cytochrome c peroxidase